MKIKMNRTKNVEGDRKICKFGHKT